jgi:hypothetical protein
LANNQNHLETIFPSFGYNSFPGIFNGFIRPSQEVQKILDSHRFIFSDYYVIGVQLRSILRLHKQAEAHVIRIMLYLKSQAEGFQRKPVVFYICPDTKEVWDRVVAAFGKDIMFSASVAAGRVGRATKEVPTFSVGPCCSSITTHACGPLLPFAQRSSVAPLSYLAGSSIRRCRHVPAGRMRRHHPVA